MIGTILQRVLRFLHLMPLSLAEKCRFMFGAAVLFSLILALLIPYVWMRQLTGKVLLDTNKARSDALLRSHFRPVSAGDVRLAELNEHGAARDPNERSLVWIDFRKEQAKNETARLSPVQKKLLEGIRGKRDQDDAIALTRVSGTLQSDYVRMFRATEGCVSCHGPQGIAGTFSLHEEVGAAFVQSRRVGGELSKMKFMNRIWTVMAGVIGLTGAVVAFYWITQRVILRPIRQLRALANNVAEGNLDVRSSIATGDEYEKLAQAFNHMLDHLQATQEDLREANRRLDAKIAELSESNIELFKANKLKSEFLANMSHEFRTPLNAILGFAQVLREKPGLLKREKGQRYAENIITSGNRLLAMINDLLDLAKTQAGKMGLHVEQASISQICESAVSSFSLLARKKRIRMYLEVSPAVPLVMTDAGKVQQVLYNFLSNAVKFTPLRGRIDVRASMVDDKTVRIAISDTGCGIAQEDQDMIFDQFRQADGSLTREAPGSGLGLAISKELAGMLAGSIGLHSEVGVGSTFWLDLPVTLRPAEGDRDPSREIMRLGPDSKRPDAQQPFGLGSRLGRAPTGETGPVETQAQPGPGPQPAVPAARIEDIRPRRTTPLPLQPEIANPEVKD
jgi:two-component system sensor histidine kinase BarA